MAMLASRILMVRPANFGFNPETAESNAFQQRLDLSPSEVASRAVVEFDRMVESLRDNGVEVVVLKEPYDAETPDAVFPNNWFSTHPDGTLVLYPMEAPARRRERGLQAAVENHFSASRTLDLTTHESKGKYLEGTGSLVIDHKNKIAFACLSSRTHPDLLNEWAEKMSFRTVCFHAYDADGGEIYHTNVMMFLTNRFAVACIESITDKEERTRFKKAVASTGRELMEISHDQMNNFAGNMIEITNSQGDPIILASRSAVDALNGDQLDALESEARVIAFDIDVIETCGGGSVRCMVAELF